MNGRSFKGEQAGFTLVEMLVALALFAAIAAMGVAMLRASVDTQDAVQGRLAAMSGLNRLRAVTAHDLAQALPRMTRDESGADVPAFIGNASEFSFVHGGASGLEASAKPDAERVRYALETGAWVRASQPMLDGTAMPRGDPLARNVASAAVRYRDTPGRWHDIWPVPGGEALPRAVEVTITKKGGAPLKMLFLLAPMPVPDPLTGEGAAL